MISVFLYAFDSPSLDCVFIHSADTGCLPCISHRTSSSDTPLNKIKNKHGSCPHEAWTSKQVLVVPFNEHIGSENTGYVLEMHIGGPPKTDRQHLQNWPNKRESGVRKPEEKQDMACSRNCRRFHAW